MKTKTEKIETIDELNQKYYTRFTKLKNTRVALGDPVFKFMSEKLFEEYKTEYQLYALQRNIDTARKTYQLEAEEYYLTPRIKRSLWSFFRRKRNKAAKLLDAETDLAVRQFFDAIEQELEEETPQELDSSEEPEAETSEDPDLSEEIEEEPEEEMSEDPDPDSSEELEAETSEEPEEETPEELDTAEDPDPDLSEELEEETSEDPDLSEKLDTAALEALESARDKWRKLALFAEECSDEEEQEMYAEEADWLSKIIALAERNNHTPKDTDSGGGESPGE